MASFQLGQTATGTSLATRSWSIKVSFIHENNFEAIKEDCYRQKSDLRSGQNSQVKKTYNLPSNRLRSVSGCRLNIA